MATASVPHVQIDPGFQALIPPLSPDELSLLEENLLRDGCRDALVTWNGLLLDGHNRHAICLKHGLWFETTPIELTDRDAAQIWIIRNQFGRRNLAPFARAELALKLEPLVAAKAKANQRLSDGRGQKGSPELANLKPVDTRAEIAKAAGVSHGTIDKARTITAKAPEPVKEQLRRGEISIDRAYQDIRGHERRAERVENLIVVSRGNADLSTDTTYPVIYADPPWRYEHVKTDNRAIENQYPTMDLEEICELPVNAIATPDALLFMWATSPKLAEAMRVVEAWGFTYRTSMVWVKDQIGMGYYARQRHELLLIATKGQPPVPEPANRPDSVVTAPRTEHSAKPAAFYEVIERMYPELPKIELFCRAPRDGWAVWGNQSAVAS